MEPISLPEAGIAAGNSSSVAQERFHVLVGVTGSVAALKLPLLVAELLKIPGLEVKVVTTERAKHFYNAQEIPVTLYGDEEEWQLWKGRSDPVLHIELRRWADLMVVAPLDANTLAKVANGICDNLLTCVIRAWDLSKPLLFCPAMNTAMWEHPITARQVEQLKGFGYTEIPCVVKKLVCGDEGNRSWCREKKLLRCGQGADGAPKCLQPVKPASCLSTKSILTLRQRLHAAALPLQSRTKPSASLQHRLSVPAL
ncbi:phosphopantothenoylcysteine decarboxylase isoform X2 [Vidua macroura]|nr:phosphopantothenoylcysteine decarboxylase isoform X2 [Vidua macroura]